MSPRPAPLQWTGMCTARSDCSEPDPEWPWKSTGMDHPPHLWATYSCALLLLSKNPFSYIWAVSTHCWLVYSLLHTSTPKSFSASLCYSLSSSRMSRSCSFSLHCSFEALFVLCNKFSTLQRVLFSNSNLTHRLQVKQCVNHNLHSIEMVPQQCRRQLFSKSLLFKIVCIFLQSVSSVL